VTRRCLHWGGKACTAQICNWLKDGQQCQLGGQLKRDRLDPEDLANTMNLTHPGWPVLHPEVTP